MEYKIQRREKKNKSMMIMKYNTAQGIYNYWNILPKMNLKREMKATQNSILQCNDWKSFASSRYSWSGAKLVLGSHGIRKNSLMSKTFPPHDSTT